MSPTPDSTLDDPQEVIADLQRQLAESKAERAGALAGRDEVVAERDDALARETAIAEVLGLINSSPDNLAPVFDVMLERAMRLCEAAFGLLMTFDGEAFRATTQHGLPAEFAEYVARNPTGWRGAHAQLAAGAPLVHVLDAKDDPAYLTLPSRQALVDLGGARSFLLVPLRRDERLLGSFAIYRQEVRPFTDRQVALLQNFAAQAVIAMENARLLGDLHERTADLQESLQYQTATSDVLKVISRSTFDLQPVLQTLAETAAHLCEAEMAFIVRREGEVYRTAVTVGFSPEAMEDARGYHAFLAGHPIAPGRGTLTGRVALEGRAVHIVDVASDPEYAMTEAITLGQVRTQLGVPLMREGSPIGVLILSRQRVEAFTEKQIELVTTFADQAVIAIENARLITETREALDQQTATAEVLGVINSSPGDLQPVFNILLEKAMQLCGAAFGALAVAEGNTGRNVAVRGAPAFAEFRRRNPSPNTPGSIAARWLSGEQVIHIVDVKDDDLYRNGDPYRRALVDLGGARSVLYVGLQKEGEVLGAISIFRQEVRPFLEKEIALLRSFAAQAVIAMENARLLDEVRQRQQELRVTFDNMADGVAMFDEALHLAAWNRNFQELLDLPDTVLAERPSYADYLRILAERGEFGTDDIEAELRRRLENADQELRLERTRPNGQVIEVRRNAVPDGGFVLIYSDITERKRSEAEIRAARDAAEATLRELRAAQANLIQAEKMASLGQLTAGIAHEIKNPLNFVNNFASLSNELLEELKEEAEPALATLDGSKRAEIDETLVMLSGNLEKIAEHGKRADNIVKSMLEHSRGVSGERRAVDLNILIDEALNLAYHGARAQDASFNITLERAFDPALAQIELAPQEITRVFLNLFGNGFYATTKRAREAGNGSFRPILAVTTRDLGDEVEVRVRDNGTGIAPEIRDKLFQPFFTTKPTGEGTGLGLSISYDIVTQQHGGTITVESEPEAFTEFTVRLPRDRQAAGTGVSA